MTLWTKMKHWRGLENRHEEAGASSRSMAQDLLGGPPAWPSGQHSLVSYHQRVTAAYRGNPIGYRAVRMIAEACASVPLCVVGKTLSDASIQNLQEMIDQPHPHLAGRDLIDRLITTLMVHGNAYLERVRGQERSWFYPVLPEHMQVSDTQSGWPSAYTYRQNGRDVHFDQTQDIQPILHLRCYDPGKMSDGTSPLEAASAAVMIHNAASAWTRALFENAARPSGAFIYRGRDGQGQLTQEQYDRLRQELEDNFQGARNAGRPLLLEGGMDWHSLSLTPQDMDFIDAKHSAARDIALALGVPPMLLGIPGDNTYSNYAEANRSFWRATVLPLMDRVARAWGHFLAQEFKGVSFRCELDQLPALSEERFRLWSRIGAANFMSDAEKRDAVGLPERSCTAKEDHL